MTTVANVETGELIEQVSDAPSDVLTAALVALYQLQGQYDEWATALQDEIRARMREDDVESAAFGEYEVTRVINYTRKWDLDELEGVLNDLVEQGTIKAKDAAEVLLPPKPAMSGTAANSLMKRNPEVEQALRACFTWDKKEPAKLLVNRRAESKGDGGE